MNVIAALRHANMVWYKRATVNASTMKRLQDKEANGTLTNRDIHTYLDAVYEQAGLDEFRAFIDGELTNLENQ